MHKALAVLFCISVFSATVSAEERGIRLSVKTRNDTVVPLYAGYKALVIGVGDYHKGWPKLPNPPKDAREVAGALTKVGFSEEHIEVISDPSSVQLKDAFSRLVRQGTDEHHAVFIYFAGHGYTLKQADGTALGFIVPADAPDPDEDMVGFLERAVSMRDIETYAQLIRSRHVLMMFDSCFSGALFTVMRGKPSPFIEEKISQPVRQFITAGQENEGVPDKSVFKEVFIEGVQEGYADLNRDGYVTGEELGAYLQEQVVNYSNKMQHPQFGKINNPRLDKGDFVFSPAMAAEAPAVTVKGAPVEPPVKGMQESAKETPAIDRTDTTQAFSGYAEPAEGAGFILVKGGCYSMGDVFGGGEADEGPVHEVCVKDFSLGKYEVTVGEFRKFVNATGFRTDAEKGGGCLVWTGRKYDKDSGRTWQNPGFAQSDRHPVVCVSWNDAQAYAEWLSGKTGRAHRFPTEAEWEYAARGGGRKQKWAGTDHEADLGAYAWFADSGEGLPQPVGRKKPNSLGLYDMSGNVWEFVQDWYDENHYRQAARENPGGPARGEYKVIRGGSSRSPASALRTAKRYWDRPDYRSPNDGFRLVMGGDQ